MTEDKKDAFLIARIPQAVKDMLEDLADDQGINLSELIRRMLEDYFGEAEISKEI